jgi:PAS domain S-box-containing protein
VPYFICPNCKHRSIDHDRRESLTDPTAIGCHRCGFGFLFELMDDYYAAPTTGMVVCDAGGRILAAGRGIFELTGFQESELMGREVVDALHLDGFTNGQDPVALALEWGVRRLGEQCEVTAAGGRRKPVTADIFPAYDEDGGLLVALTTR